MNRIKLRLIALLQDMRDARRLRAGASNQVRIPRNLGLMRVTL